MTDVGSKLETLTGTMAGQAMAQLAAWSDYDKGQERHARIRELPLLIRRHGLNTTLGHWQAGDDKDQSLTVGAAFLAKLNLLAPGTAKAGDNASLMLRTRLALAMADEWLALSESMMATGNSNSTSMSNKMNSIATR